jgi:hypothetical protein
MIARRGGTSSAGMNENRGGACERIACKGKRRWRICVFGCRKLRESALRIAGRTCSSLSTLILALSSFSLNLPLPTTPPTIPSIRSRRMSFFSRKKNVSPLHLIPLPLSFPHPSFSFPLLFISFRRSTRLKWRYKPHSPLAIVTCKPVALCLAFTPALTASRPSTIHHPTQ